MLKTIEKNLRTLFESLHMTLPTNSFRILNERSAARNGHEVCITISGHSRETLHWKFDIWRVATKRNISLRPSSRQRRVLRNRREALRILFFSANKTSAKQTFFNMYRKVNSEQSSNAVCKSLLQKYYVSFLCYLFLSRRSAQLFFLFVA